MSAGRIHAEPLRLPFQGDEPRSRHTSYAGAKAASERVARQAMRLIDAYRDHGPLTDAEAAFFLGVERTTINARRAELIARSLVESKGTRKSVHGISNTTWGLV